MVKSTRVGNRLVWSPDSVPVDNYEVKDSVAVKADPNHAMDEKPTVERPRYVVFFTGATACGKSTIAKHVTNKLNLTFLEGDDVRQKKDLSRPILLSPKPQTNRSPG